MSKLSSKVDERPAMQFYLKDWLADTRILNLAERGLWIDALAFMWRSPQRGKLLMQNGCKPDAEAMQNLFGTQNGEAETVIDRLVAKGLASFVHRGKRREFKASDPMRFQELLGEMEEKLSKIKNVASAQLIDMRKIA